MKQKTLIFIAAIAFMISGGSASLYSSSESNLKKIVFINSQKLEDVRQQPAKKEYAAVIKKIKRDAGKAIDMEPVSVTEKTQNPPSGDKHDYMSMARYWFPDPSKSDGKPYIRKDGETNPEILDYRDHENLEKLIKAVESLSLAYYLTSDESYAEHASELIRVWFLDPKTKMNPNMEFAQAVPGRNEGRGAGILDARRIAHLLDGISLLEGSKFWTSNDNTEMNKWLEEYLSWLQKSKNGKSEFKAKNNHGSWFAVQITSIALYLDKKDIAEKILGENIKQRIADQIEPDGRQPEELVRTRSLHYSLFNLEALFELALLGDKIGINLWDFKTQDGRCIQKALDFILPSILGEKDWEYKQIDEVRAETFYPLFKLASEKYPEDQYVKRYMEKYAKDKQSDPSNVIF